MKTRFIAAALVMVALWSVSAPLALGAPLDAARQKTTLKTHACCPRGSSAFAFQMFVTFAPATMPCGGQSPCCAKQAPAKPAIPALNQNEQTAMESVPGWEHDAANNDHTGISPISADFSPSLFLHSTVLRI